MECFEALKLLTEYEKKKKLKEDMKILKEANREIDKSTIDNVKMSEYKVDYDPEDNELIDSSQKIKELIEETISFLLKIKFITNIETDRILIKENEVLKEIIELHNLIKDIALEQETEK